VLPKVEVYSIPIEADIKEANCVQTFATHHDTLINTQLMLIYNVLNEIETEYAHMVLRNLSYIIRQCEQPVLVLLAEPAAKKALPRIKWIRQLLLQYSTVIIDELNENISFQAEPIMIELKGVNHRLFSKDFGKNPPDFETTLNRVIMACHMTPPEPFSSQQYEQLRRQFAVRRDRKGKIMKESTPRVNSQLSLF
jgi:hypothetical protein